MRFFVIWFGLCCCWTNWSRAFSQPNVLFLMIDDLRPALGVYRDALAVTPNLDFLGSKSVVFEKAYAQQALCGPSRISIMTSRRPHSLSIYGMGTYWRDQTGTNFTTLPQFFKSHGYETIPLGKIFHGNMLDQPYSWSRPTNMFFNEAKHHMGFCRKPGFSNLICPVDTEEMELEGVHLIDRKILHTAKNYLIHYNKRVVANQSGPLFLAIGFHKPHIPWIVPQEFPDIFSVEDIPKVQYNMRSPSTPMFAYSDYGLATSYPEFRLFNMTNPMRPMSEDFRIQATQYYYACVTYIDNLVGQLLVMLDQNHMLDDTIINVISDHGFSLGENGELAKHSNFEVATRVPWMIYDPLHTSASLSGFKLKPPSKIADPSASLPVPYKTIHDPVELVDVFPTLTELAGLGQIEKCNQSPLDKALCSDGVSQARVVINENPKTRSFSSRSAGVRSAAFSQFPRKHLNMVECPSKFEFISAMGYSVRTNEFRYTEWNAWDNELGRPKRDQILGKELYDHRENNFEHDNLAEHRSFDDVVRNLSALIKITYGV
ncbi:hypothetical protein TCAL_12535 [Tigriopus californicus]|uniref:Sulfatase N-terminal domain-containing protein n=1 Tax=Tigriopus californicus TaxID=6832 RepID=A0A553N8R9_TIGCA|nr:iduronate 2-sulfatase-like [Tigriopus californicus]TRY61825.1 hypothetical protein TCAL_12535 [Tigriopus californicus]|eukprot:TCALIF_12535-PA protein Name:"Similar to Ids Iduronate 2-sulfatase (Mus musculus)" AED:0.01 eAED:0.01 QI:0/-1/0/1/-1/1/1/0/543